MKKKKIIGVAAIIGVTGFAAKILKDRKINKTRNTMIKDLRPDENELDINIVTKELDNSESIKGSELVSNSIIMLNDLYNSEVSFDDIYKLITNEGSCLEVAIANYEISDSKDKRVLKYFKKDYLPGLMGEIDHQNSYSETEDERESLRKLLKY